MADESERSLPSEENDTKQIELQLSELADQNNGYYGDQGFTTPVFIESDEPGAHCQNFKNDGSNETEMEHEIEG